MIKYLLTASLVALALSPAVAKAASYTMIGISAAEQTVQGKTSVLVYLRPFAQAFATQTACQSAFSAAQSDAQGLWGSWASSFGIVNGAYGVEFGGCFPFGGAGVRAAATLQIVQLYYQGGYTEQEIVSDVPVDTLADCQTQAPAVQQSLSPVVLSGNGNSVRLTRVSCF